MIASVSFCHDCDCFAFCQFCLLLSHRLGHQRKPCISFQGPRNHWRKYFGGKSKWIGWLHQASTSTTHNNNISRMLSSLDSNPNHHDDMEQGCGIRKRISEPWIGIQSMEQFSQESQGSFQQKGLSYLMILPLATSHSVGICTCNFEISSLTFPHADTIPNSIPQAWT